MTDLSRCVRLLVAGQDLQYNAAACVLQHFLEDFGVVADLFAVHLLDDVANMKQTLLVNHATVEDPGNHQLAALYSKSHSLCTCTESQCNNYFSCGLTREGDPGGQPGNVLHCKVV